ncbi:MAG: cell division topological specificity factor MinE [Hydrogenophaga sp.]|jgi:cell division topological specificity factor|nr:cell division topological specificity factor MinE [Hydrogenophaga sp.]
MLSLSALIGRDSGKSAGVAKERLQIILALERSDGKRTEPNYLPELKNDLVAAVGRYVAIHPNDIYVHFERQDNYEVLEIKVELPD